MYTQSIFQQFISKVKAPRSLDEVLFDELSSRQVCNEVSGVAFTVRDELEIFTTRAESEQIIIDYLRKKNKIRPNPNGVGFLYKNYLLVFENIGELRRV